MLLGGIGIATAVYLYYDRVDEEIRCRVVELIAEHYGSLQVTARSAELVEDGIEIRGLSIVEPGAEGAHAELIYLDEVFLECNTDWQELLEGKLQVRQVTVRRPKIVATRRPDGTFSTAKLLPPPKFSEHPPKVIVENGTVEIFDPLKTPSGTLTLRDVNLTIDVPDPLSQTPNARPVQGTFSADHLRHVELTGQVDPERRSWNFGGTIEGLDISPELRDALPGPLAAKLAALGNLRGEGTLGFRVSHDPMSESGFRYSLSGQLRRGRLDDPRLPHPLSDLRLRVRLDNEGIVIEDLFARSGRMTVRLLDSWAGFAPGSPILLQAEVHRLELDDRLLECLPAVLQKHWHTYWPAGLIDANVILHFDGKTWQPELTVQCLNVSFTHRKFPYRLENGEGELILKNDALKLDLVAYSGSQPVRVKAKVDHLTSGATGWFTAEGDELPLDGKKLLQALAEKPREVVRSLHPRGTANFYMWMGRDDPRETMRQHLEITLNGCSMCYEKFPYPIGNIRGTLEMNDGNWEFHDNLKGTNDTGHISCQGHLTSPQQGQELYLRFDAQDVALEEELRNALPPGMQQVWNGLQPRGRIDLEKVVVRLSPADKQPVITVHARPQPDSTSIELTRFPYRLENLEGLLIYHDGKVEILGPRPNERFRAEHGSVKAAAVGACYLQPDGRWQLKLDRLTVDRLQLDDHELVRALPEQLKNALAQLDPRGPINLQGSFGLEGGALPGDQLRSRWDLNVDFHQGSIDIGVPLRNLHGSVRLKGAIDHNGFHSIGELDVDSLTYKDFQLTEVKGPLWVDSRKAGFGSLVAWWRNEKSAQATRQTPTPLTARLFGGTVRGDAWIALEEEPRYGLHATLEQADLSRCAREMMAGRQDLKGKITATVDLGGVGSSPNGMQGQGNIQLREGDVYELPLMIALLNSLGKGEPDTTAFSESSIDFRIHGGHIYFPQIEFRGDALSLRGGGEMDFQSNIHLSFYPELGNSRMRLPVFSDLLGGASRQIMQIHVGGTLQDPRIQREAFPGVNQALQELQNEIERGAASEGFFPQVGGNRMLR